MDNQIQNSIVSFIWGIADDCLHSFYFYVLPFNDGETDKKDIMEAVLKGDVDL